MAKKKKYGIPEKVSFHEKRAVSSSASEVKKLYSKQWLEGFHDTHAECNYGSVCQEIDFRKKDKDTPRGYRIMLNAYRNGLKAQLDSKKRI